MAGDWDFRNFHVQKEVDQVAFPTAETILISAGEPELGDNITPDPTDAGAQSEATFSPLGLVENFGINQNMGNQKIFEVGSSRSYIIPGKYTGAINMSRILGYMDSILRAMYQGRAGVRAMVQSLIDAKAPETLPGALLNQNFQTDKQKTELLWMNIGSQVFLQKIGLLFWIVGTSAPRLSSAGNESQVDFDAAIGLTSNVDYGAFYLEHGTLTGHQFGANAGAVVLMENVGMMYERLVPVSVSQEIQSNIIQKVDRNISF